MSGTPEHPFFVPARDEYVAMGELEVGTVLRTTDGSLARVVGSERRQGSFKVFNFEVEDSHNYYVSSPRGSPQDFLIVADRTTPALRRACFIEDLCRANATRFYVVVIRKRRHPIISRTVSFECF
ncbi:hypothetical protein FRC98_08515 [Lujinxingia vulgaris]|uniref:Uncharacterized protein n=1 Tax=Lujinxingia vulgaris TaxID=2600176 RepID=A0A5C6XB45_9DELT|nr:polymorphic toxin-type HINT domain-containing protein [Lujinxingia vulgaris]TXD37720.1 hypothetical protein FRC98_08515 [Lujinxingia vulgaris]